MARKTRKQLAEDAKLDMVCELVQWYRDSLRQIPATEKAAEVKYVVDAGIRIISFLEPYTPKPDDKTQAQPDGIDKGKLDLALGTLLSRQRATPPPDAIEHITPPTK